MKSYSTKIPSLTSHREADIQKAVPEANIFTLRLQIYIS
jgi:hypothetical protein